VGEYELWLWRLTGWTAQLAAAGTGVYLLLRAALLRPPRWRAAKFPWRKAPAPRWWLILFRAERDSPALRLRRSLLMGCGLRWSAHVYLAARRTGIAVGMLIAGGAWLALAAGRAPPVALWPTAMAASFMVMVMLADRTVLGAIRRNREDRIRIEIVALCRGLLYYSGSRLHLHGKLMRCLPYVRLIRGDLQLLLNEWYQDADASLERFKKRLGTEEARAFAETVRTLRLHEDDEVYGMLRQLADTCKEKIRFARESRREMASYGLYVLAGIPVLYMFHVFLYPWVREVRVLLGGLQG